MYLAVKLANEIQVTNDFWLRLRAGIPKKFGLVVESFFLNKTKIRFSFQDLKEIATRKTIKPDFTHLTAYSSTELAKKYKIYFFQNKVAPMIAFSELSIVTQTFKSCVIVA